MLTDKLPLLVLAICLIQLTDSLKCPGPSIRLGHCHDGVKKRFETYFVNDHGLCKNRTSVSYIHCKPQKSHHDFCKCSAIGDPHYRTYDGQTIHYFGDCKYLLTQYWGKKDHCSFKIVVKNEKKGQHTKLTRTKSVFIHIFGDVFKLGREQGLKVNGVHQNIPYEKGVEVRIFVSGKLLQFVAPRCGVNVAFDGDNNVFVEVSRRFAGKLKGICGNCDGLQNDFKTASGLDVSNNPNKFNLIGDSYGIGSKQKPCSPAPKFDWKHICKGEWRSKIKNLEQCGSLLSRSGPFKECGSKGNVNLKDFFDDCRIDVCSNLKNEKHREKARCKILEGVAEICAEAGFPGIKWRSQLRCPLHCGENQHFTTNATPCPRTCENHFYGTQSPCYHLPEREACECNDGYLRDGALCVKPSHCTCLDFCSDREKETKCLTWMKQGKCAKFPEQMKVICKKTCGFCKVKSHRCKDDLNTWKCIQFRDEGKCVEDFYKTVCGLTCNYDKCACEKDKTVIGPCNEIEKKRTITHIHFVRNRHGRCKKIVTQRTEVCGCPFIYRTIRGDCNYCTGRISIAIYIQKEVNGVCIRRTSHTFILCSRCPANPRLITSCLHNNQLIKTTLFNKRIGCFRCIPARISVSLIVRCKSNVITGRCNPRTCLRTITYIIRKPRNCRCLEHRYQKSLICCCKKKDRDLKPFCCNGKIIHRRIIYQFIRGLCRPHFKDRIETPVCNKPVFIKGRCQRFRGGKLYCIAEDNYIAASLNNQCKCVSKHHRHSRICCCRGPIRYRTCNRNLGIVEITVIAYTLAKKGRESYCLEHVKKTRKTICFQTKYIRKEGKCRPNCLRTDSIFKKYRDGCRIKKVFVRLETKPCCCLPGTVTRSRCVANFVIVTATYKRILVGCGCIEYLIHSTKTLINCPPPREIRGGCIYRGYRRLVTKIFYKRIHCRCVRHQKTHLEQCRPCPFKIYKEFTTKCDRNTCTQVQTTYFQDIDCKYKVKRCTEICCCKDKPWQRKYCDENTGITYTINYWYEFHSRTKTCCEKSKKVASSVACILVVIVKTGKCGKLRKHYKRRTFKRYVLDKHTCSCKPLVTVEWIICKCHPTKYSKWRCQSGYLIREVTTYSINIKENRCVSRTVKEIKCIRCPKPKPDQTVQIHRCKYIVYRFFYRINRCRCQLNRIPTVYFRCCRRRPKVVKRCVKDHSIVTTVTTYRVRPDKRRCIACVSTRSRVIRCKVYIKRSRTPCIRGKYFKITIYFGVRKCTCVKIRVRKIQVICECFPKKPTIKTVCLGNKWLTTVTRIKLHRRRCIPCLTHTETSIYCQKTSRTRGPCNRKTGQIKVREQYYVVVKCKCIRKIKYSFEKCPCWRPDRIIRPSCVSNTRIVRLERFLEVHGRCIWVTILKEIEHCRCKVRTSITKCYRNSVYITTITSYHLVLVNLRIPVRRCRKRVIQRIKSVVCNRDYKYTTPCKNYQQSIIACSYTKVNCQCRESCKLVCVRACNCRHRNYCKTRCFRNVKQKVCHTFTDRGVGCYPHSDRCIENKSITTIKQTCSPPFVPKMCYPCNIYRNNAFYRKCTKFFINYINCQCVPGQVSYIEFCNCKGKHISKPFCRRNRFVTITTYYIKQGLICVPKTTKCVRPIGCPKPYITIRNLRCETEYRLTYYIKSNCQCVKRYLIKRNKKCCYKRTTNKYCKRNLWIYVERSYIQRNTNVKLFPRIPNSPTATFCQCVKRKWEVTVCCPGKPYTVERCNKRTKRLRIDFYHQIIINCICVKKITTTYGHCTEICPKPSKQIGKCGPSNHNGYGFRDITITYYKVTIKNHCKKLIKHKRKICRCPKCYSRTYCKNGGIVTETVTYDLHSRSPCAKHVSITIRSVCCYNHGKPNPWILKKIERCRKPGQYTFEYYERSVFNSATCGCNKVMKRVRTEICCKGCHSTRRCIRNSIVHTTVCERPKGLKCVVYKTSSTVFKQCLAPIKKKIGKCVKGYQKYSLTTYRKEHCKCRKTIVYRRERCKCFPTSSKQCVGNRWKITRNCPVLKNGRCVSVIKISFESIFCIQIIIFKDIPINKCTFWRYTYNKVVKNCQCVNNLLSKEKLYSCCKRPMTVTKCKKNNIIVKITRYFVLVQFHCYPRTRIQQFEIKCSKPLPVKEIKIGLCKVKVIYFIWNHTNCRCHLKQSRFVIKETCCDHKKPYTKRICDKRTGTILTYYYTYYLGCDGRCHKVVKVSKFKVNCNRRHCRTVIGPCRNNTRIVKLFCMRRVGCRCRMKLIHQGYQCCNIHKFKFKVVGKCIKCMEKVTYYAYKLDKKVNLCRASIIREISRRCCCRRRFEIKVCVNDIYKKTTIVSYILNKVCYTCVETRSEHVKVIRGCSKKKRLLGIVKRTCNKHTGRGYVTYEYIFAKNCHCVRIRKTKPIICICEKAYPTRVRTFCKHNKITVRETITANCRGEIVTFTTTTEETPLTNCDKIVVEKSVCFRGRDGDAVSIRYVTKIEYKSRNCKCYRREIERKKKHCRCRRSWTNKKCVHNRLIITIFQITLKLGKCHRIVKSKIRNIPCPVHPRVTRTRCINNHYQVITETYLLQNCHCTKCIRQKPCDCACPRKSVHRRCTRRYIIQIKTVVWTMVHCRCVRHVSIIEQVPLCPRFIRETVGPCIKHRKIGYRKITTRTAVKLPRICKCKIVSSTRSEVCWCSEKVKHKKHCDKNNIFITEVWKLIISKTLNRCQLVKITCSTAVIVPLKTVVIYKCNKVTGKETKTTISYSVVNCRLVKHVKVKVYDCICTKEWKLIKRGKCSGQPRCIRTDIYQREELRNRRCVKITEYKYKKCCCNPPQKVFKYCKNNRLYTLIITFILKKQCCYPTKKLTFTSIFCPLLIIKKETKCNKRGYKFIRYFGYVVRNCRCVLKMIKETLCCCRCPKPRTIFSCQRKKRIRTKIVTTYSIVDCKCVAKVQRSQVCILCPKDRKIVSKCLPVKNRPYFVITTVRIRYTVNRHCACVAIKSLMSVICKCRRNEHKKRICDKKRHVITEKVTYTVLRCNRCVTRVICKRFQVKCSPSWWILKSDSGCVFNSLYGERILTYFRKVPIGCHCKEVTRTVRYVCRCTGPSRRSQCVGTRIKTIHFSYHIINHKCVKRHRVSWRTIVCRPLPPIKEPCREVAKYVFMQYTIYRDRFVLNCRCLVRQRRVERICRCRDGYTKRRCNSVTNQWLFMRIWFELLTNRCVKQTETKISVCPCNLIPECRVISSCKSGSHTQHYECIERYRRNCICYERKIQYTQKCECKPKKIIRGPCNKHTCFRDITIITYHLFVLRNGKKKCIQSNRIIRERCCCHIKPVKKVECKNNKLIITTISYHFNKKTKVCDSTCSVIDRTPECCPAKQEHRRRCNRRTCIRNIKITLKTLRNCRCILTESRRSEECCCKEKDYSQKVCIRGNIFKTTTYTHKFENCHCKTYTSETYERAKCPENKERYGPCRKSTLTQTKKVIKYVLQSCQCIPKISICDLICGCPPPFSTRICLPKTGVIQTTFTWFVFDKKLHKCYKYQRQSIIQIFCHTKPRTVCKDCRVIYHSGTYKMCTTRYQVRVGCKCHNKVYCHFKLCYCPKPYRFVVCEKNQRLIKEVYYVRIPSPNTLYGFICVRRIKVVSRVIIDCLKSTITHGPCIRGIMIYTLRYYRLINCICVMRTKIFRVKCRCPRPRVISRRCIDQVRKEIKIRSYRLLCDKKAIPSCRCVSFDRIKVSNVICKKHEFKVKKCKNGRKKIVSIHYKPRHCKCHRIKHVTYTKDCDESCYDMPHCAAIKKLGLCNEDIYRNFECQITCGYCVPCKRDEVVKHVGKCKCVDIDGLKICTRKTIVKHYRSRNGRCIHSKRVYRSICNCLNKYPQQKCKRLKKDGKCKEREVMRNCERTCNPNCRIRCHGQIKRRRCVQSGPYKGKYKVIVIYFVRLGKICIVKVRTNYLGQCKPCSKNRRIEVTNCIGHVRYVVTHFVLIINGKCVNKIRRVPFSCKSCCPSTETLIGDCIRGYRRVVTVFWANINHCCKKQTITNIYSCNKRCLGVLHVSSKCLLNKRIDFKIWKSGRNCNKHVASKVVSCVPVPI